MASIGFSSVTFTRRPPFTCMGVPTVGVIIRSREILRMRSRSLALRSSSMCVQRALKQAVPLYGCVVGPDTTRALTGTAGSLGTWVAVPRRGARVDRRAEVFASTPSNAPDPIGLGPVAVSRRGASMDVDPRAEGRIATVARRAGS
jgi:hypothetical protein